MIVAALVGLFLVACKNDGLESLLLDGPELHESLVTLHVDELPLHVLRENPQLSTDAAFVEAVARGSSQGRLDSEGIRAAFYAVYRDESGVDVGFYGLQAASTAEAGRREELLRDIWALNTSLERARVYRSGELLVVAWNGPVSPSCWGAVSSVVAERLGAR